MVPVAQEAALQSSKPVKPVPLKIEDEKGRIAGVDIRTEPAIWQEFNEKAQQEGKSASKKIAQLIENAVDPNIDASSLSMTAQQKLDAVIKQQRRKLEAEFAERVRLQVVERGNELANFLLEKARKQEKEDYDAIALARRTVKRVGGGLLSRATFNLIRSCLHLDSRKSASDEKLNRAFHAFAAMEKLISEDEPNLKSNIPETPKTREDWEKIKQQVAEARRAKRDAAKATKNAVQHGRV